MQVWFGIQLVLLLFFIAVYCGGGKLSQNLQEQPYFTQDRTTPHQNFTVHSNTVEMQVQPTAAAEFIAGPAQFPVPVNLPGVNHVRSASPVGPGGVTVVVPSGNGGDVPVDGHVVDIDDDGDKDENKDPVAVAVAVPVLGQHQQGWDSTIVDRTL